MRQLSRDPMAGEKARKAEMKANEGAGLISIKLGGSGSGGGDTEGSGGFKKGGFKKAGFKSAFGPAEGEASQRRENVKDVPASLVESDTEDEGYDVYDPRKPTA